MPATFTYFPFDTGPGANSDEIRWGEMMRWMRTTGVITASLTLDPATDDLAVTANGTLGVQVAIGIAWMQGFYFEQSDDYYAVGLNPNTSGDPRIDLLVLSLNLITNIIEYVVLEGTPAASPVVPTPQQDADIWQMPLAEIAVADGAVTILSGDITDVRVRSVQGDGGSSAVTLDSAGGDETLVNDGVGPDLVIKGLSAGTNITLTPSGDDITIEATGAGSSVTLSNAGTTSLVNDGVGPALANKGLVAGTNVTFGTSATDVTINADTVTLTSAGGTETLVNDGTGQALATKGLSAGTGVSLSSSATAVTITNSDPASGVTLTNAGTTSLVNDGVGPALANKGLVAGTNVTFGTSATDVTINADTVTLTNAGTTSLVNDGTGQALATKGLVAGTGVSFSTSATDVTITNSDPASGVTLTSAGGTETLVNDGTGPALANKGLTAGTGVSLSSSATAVTITNSDPASGVTLTNAGTTSLVNDGVGPALANKGLVAGTNVTFGTSATDVTINADTVTLTSAGGTETLVNDGTGQALATKGLTAGTGISLSSTSTAVTITNSDTGSAVTLSNAGTTSLVNDGVGPALATKGLVAGSNMTFSTSATDVTITNSNAPTNSPVCALNRTTDISVPNNTVTNITWSSGYDPLSMWDGSQSITIPQTGLYLLQLRFSYITPALANGYLYAVIINSTTGGILGSWTVLGAASVTYSMNANVSTQITASQVIKAYAFQTSGQTCTVDATLGLIQPRLSVIKLRET
jgi:hypothetical protein